ncbi:superoxide dismutase family protein [Aquibium sp. A9E412]|uniref:superoxide dismutase family protein n=1 Tax=Aquibium sp. A9E412 TaxID=2976767 RepID=UPI0025AF19A5|nr:superoxide dismutase family protein [Aquibium sp. A9E412]MDN2567746.1 superoxide dismutase family protein [Aquibium sp. A9E412]
MSRILACALSALLVSTAGAAAQSTEGRTASANMINTDEVSVGTVTFNETRSGMLHVIVEMTDLPAGPHGFHVHETGTCDPADGFKSAGGHYAAGKDHGIASESGPHPGDFPNVQVAANGVLVAEFFTDRLSIADGDNPLNDADGSAVVVHSGQDDYTSQPSGEAGERIACGIVE